MNAIGADLLGWQDRIPFLEQRTGTISILGFDLGVPLALIVVILYQAWRYFPFSFLFILARLEALPTGLDEAARVDGATPLQRFWRITLPQLGHRPADGPPLHPGPSTSSTTSSCSPRAAPAPRWCRCGSTAT